MTKPTGKARKRKAKVGAARKTKKPVDFEAVRTQINDLVGNQALDLVESAIAEAEKGHFTAMKYLFEMTGLYPATEHAGAPGEESLARTLLQRLGFPEEAAVETEAGKDKPAGDAAGGADAVE